MKVSARASSSVIRRTVRSLSFRAVFLEQRKRLMHLQTFVYRDIDEDLEDGAGNPIADSKDRVMNGLGQVGL